MRHVYVNRTTYILTLLLVMGALLFAWVRSNDIVFLAQEERVVQEYDWQQLGSQVFSDSCAGCHTQLTYIPRIFQAEGGREYLANFMVHGVLGELQVDGEVTTERHRAYDSLSDEELAAVLNYMLVSWGNDEAFDDTPEFYQTEELAEVRDNELEREEVFTLRPSID